MATSPVDYLSGLGGLKGLPSSYETMQGVHEDQQNNQRRDQQLQLGAQVLAQGQAEQQQQQEYQAAAAAALRDGSPAAISALITRFPQQHAAIAKGWEIKDTGQKQADLRSAGEVLSALDAGRADLAIASMEARIAAEEAAGQDVTQDRQQLSAIKSGDAAAIKATQGALRYTLAAVEPDKFAATLGKVGGPGDDKFANTPQGDIYNKGTGEVTHLAGPKPDVDTQYVFDENGNRIGTRKVTHAPVGGITGEGIEQIALSAVPGAVVTSGERTPKKNAEVGGNPNSYHLTDQARDIVPPAGMSMAALHNKLQASFPGMKVLNEGDHIHIQPMARNTARSGFMSKPQGPVGASSILDDGTIRTMAEQYLAGDTSVMQNLGRGKQGSENIVRLRKEIGAQARNKGMNGADIAAQMVDFKATVAAERAVGTRIANTDLAVTEAQRLVPLALKASDDLPRNGFVPFSRAEQSVRSGTNDPRLRRFVAANNALVNVYARAISPSGQPHQSDKEHAREMLNTAYDQPSYRAVVEQMQSEMAAAKSAPRDVRADIRGGVAGVSKPRAPRAAPPADITAILRKYGH